MNEEFTPRPNLTQIGLFICFWVYISHQKRDHLILEFSHTIEAFPFKNISFKTSIIGEAQEVIGIGFSMVESSCFRGFKLYEGMEIFISTYF